ncbi:ribonuclease [Bacillus safensis]|uniref:ribonuclease n=1 Tax=Bacillus TaxID=1386 RepID=UPI0006501F9B|nr:MULTISPECIES: ribonuclease [Bacillus]KML11110.1 ribonuclease [Bacillus safensis]KML53043.1 ribonuclease [Bacillus safensis]KMN79485.1 ribonuclease [Bacillus safensis]MBG9816270.1 ribonuclease [Bacillus safensis]OYN64136.1 ribonuclease [Bacillus safensis]
MKRLSSIFTMFALIAAILFSGFIPQQAHAETPLTPTATTETQLTPDVRTLAVINTFDGVADYLIRYKRLPDNYITKSQASALGWVASKGNLAEVAPGKSIGGDIFSNREGRLPSASGRTWREADINYVSGFRNADRLVYSSDWLIYKTTDHYATFTRIR